MGSWSAGKALIVAGLALVALGVVLVLGRGLGLGRLPGDIALKRGSFRFYFPLATCLVLSLLLTLVLSLFRRR